MSIRAIYLYTIVFFWLVLLYLLAKFSFFLSSGLGISLVVVSLIYLPGTLLWRISKIETQDFWLKILYITAFGFCFYFLTNLLALLVGLNLSQLVFALLFFLIILFALAIFEDKKEYWQFDWGIITKQSIIDWFFHILIIVGGLTAILGVNAQAEKLIGDGAFHLSILNKVVNSSNFSISNLWVTQTSLPNLVYSFPIWHIFLGTLVKLLNISIFSAYIQVIYPLTIIFLLVSYGFLRTIFKNIYPVRIGFLSLIILNFIAGIYYSLVPMRSPDSLVRLLLFPLVLAISINYFYKQSSKIIINIGLISGLAISMGLIHFTQLISYVLILLVFLVLTLIFNFDKEILKKIGYLAIGLFGLILPYLLFFQFENLKSFFQGNLTAFKGDNFYHKGYFDSGNIYLYTIFSFPMIILYLKKIKSLTFVLAIPLTLMAISWQIVGLRSIFLRYFGQVFTIRALTDIPGYIFFGIMIFSILWLIDNIFAQKKIFLTISYVLLAMLSLLSFIIYRKQTSAFVDLGIFSPDNTFFYYYFIPILIILATLSIIGYIVNKYIYKKDLPDLKVKNQIHFGLWSLFIIIILTMPYYGLFKNTLKNNPNGTILANSNLKGVGDIQRIGGEKTITALAGLKSESTFVTSNVTVAQNALMYTPAFASEYPFGITNFTYSQEIYNPGINSDQRFNLLNQYKIDYIICVRPQETEIFRNDQSHFEFILTNNYQYTVTSKGVTNQKQGEFTLFKYLK